MLRKHLDEVRNTLGMDVNLTAAWRLGYRHLVSRTYGTANEYHSELKYKVFCLERVRGESWWVRGVGVHPQDNTIH